MMENEINYHKELNRIADLVENIEDKEILHAAAMKLIPGPKPSHEETIELPNGGFHYTKYYY